MSKKSIYILVVMILLSIVLLWLKRCTGETPRLDETAEVGTTRIDSHTLVQPNDTLVELPLVEPQKEECKEEKKIRKPISKKTESADKALQEEVVEQVGIEEIKKPIDIPVQEEKPKQNKEESVSEGKETVPHVQEVVQQETKIWKPQLHLKTNVIGWGMGMTNMSVESHYLLHHNKPN